MKFFIAGKIYRSFKLLVAPFFKTIYSTSCRKQDGILFKGLNHGNLTDNVKYEQSVIEEVGKTKVKTLLGPYQTYEAMLKLVKKAKNGIQIAGFYFREPSIDGSQVISSDYTKKLLQALLNKKKERPDIRVQVVLDANMWRLLPGSKFNNEKAIEFLINNGIEVQPYPSGVEGAAFCLHDKLVAADGKKVIIGSMNLTPNSAHYHESNLLIKTRKGEPHSEVDNLIWDSFHKNWNYAALRNQVLLNEPVFSPYKAFLSKIFQDKVQLYPKLNHTKPLVDPAFKILASNPESTDLEGYNPIGQYILNRLDNAKHVRVEMRALHDKGIVDKIIERKKESKINPKRPFDCKIIVCPGYAYINGTLKRLKAVGIPVKIFHTSLPNQKLHSKWAAFDKEEIVLGSAQWEGTCLKYNFRGEYWKPSSNDEKLIKGNSEIVVAIKNRNLVKTFLQQFKSDWNL